MENITSYKSKRGVHVPKDIKEYILKRVREGSKTLKEIAEGKGVSHLFCDIMRTYAKTTTKCNRGICVSCAQ